ncbi:unnamed protein product [Adineta ricciae]|uniref:Uncharacterized protein n=1 Tax=Adineta ricciae TaxID=249248 RepID=A0A815F8T1_ADIRI|nr:unnamed protein product [Adineta ricciae]
MSLYALETICNDEQKRQFLPLAHSYDITTAYAETEAKNLPRCKPSRSVNHIVLVAQLSALDQNHPCDLQMFLVQIRDLKTHEPFPHDDCLLYGTLLQAQIYLCDTFIIATCCSAVRFQRQNPQGNDIRLLDYRLQQEKLVLWFFRWKWIGDNVVLLQQTARYRLKIMEELEDNNDKNINPSVTYSNTQL